jgi:hypothetical protein
MQTVLSNLNNSTLNLLTLKGKQSFNRGGKKVSNANVPIPNFELAAVTCSCTQLAHES